MPALNFTMFTDKVADGSKTQTIRVLRTRRYKVGDTLHLFSGMRTPRCRRLSPIHGVECIEALDLAMRSERNGLATIELSGRGELGVSELRELAERDGFECLDDFIDYFFPTGGLSFNAQLIRWKWWGEPINARDPRIWLPREEAAR